MQGDWRGISKDFVTSRTPTQVASHAQKYFIRHSNQSKRKRRTSLFDLKADAEAADTMRSRVGTSPAFVLLASLHSPLCSLLPVPQLFCNSSVGATHDCIHAGVSRSYLNHLARPCHTASYCCSCAAGSQSHVAGALSDTTEASCFRTCLSCTTKRCFHSSRTNVVSTFRFVTSCSVGIWDLLVLTA